MTNDNKPPMFGPSGVFADALIGKCTTSFPFKFEFDPKDGGHSIMFGSTRNGMSGTVTHPSLLPLSALPQYAADVLMALGCQRDALESDGVSLAALSRVLGMKSTQEGDRRIMDVLLELKRLVPALSELRYSEADGLVRAGDVHQ